MKLGHALHQGEPQSGARVLARQAGIDLDKGIEQLAEVLPADAYAPVPDAETGDAGRLVRLCLETDLSPVGGKFDGVGKQVYDHLLEPPRIGAHRE